MSTPQVITICDISFRQGFDLNIAKKLYITNEIGWSVDNGELHTHSIDLLLDQPASRRLSRRHPLAITVRAIGGESRYMLNTERAAEHWLLAKGHSYFKMDRRPFRQVLALSGMIAPSRIRLERDKLIHGEYDLVDLTDRIHEIRSAGTALYVHVSFREGGPLPLPRRVALDTSVFDYCDDLEYSFVYYGN